MTKKRIDWSRQSYRATANPCSQRAALNRIACDICGERIVAGERRLVGPRGIKEAHEACAPAPATEPASPRRFGSAAGRAILATLRDLDPSALSGCYDIDIDAPDKAPLDEAVSWYLTGVRR